MIKVHEGNHGPCVLCDEDFPEQAGVCHPNTGRFICYDCAIMASAAIQLRMVELICELKAEVRKKGDDGK